jgi:methylmalonyl-CoA carboxyltransferase large subunit
MANVTLKGLTDDLAVLREQLAAMTAKLAELEGAAAAAPSHSVVVDAAPKPAAPPEEISEEILLALTAAVAAYLGKRAPIRAVRLLGSTAWAQQGRVSIQASHRLNVAHHHHSVR